MPFIRMMIKADYSICIKSYPQLPTDGTILFIYATSMDIVDMIVYSIHIIIEYIK